MQGMLRFYLGTPLEFDNITDDNWGSINRRALVVEMKRRPPLTKSTILPQRAKRLHWGISQKDDTLKGFLEERPAALAFFNIAQVYMNKRTMEESRSTIDSYARTEGTTWRVMRGGVQTPTTGAFAEGR